MSVSELFDRETAIDGLPAPEITLSALAISLNVPVARLLPLASAGYLTITKPSSTPAHCVVLAPPQRAVRWLRQWFLPARAKTLFSAADIAELLNLPARDVLRLAARFDVPTTFDSALGGLLWSTYAVRMMFRAISGLPEEERLVPRFDRQAMIHALLEGNPAKELSPPKYTDALEQEIKRVAQLPEDLRRIRAAQLWDQWLDARVVAEASPEPPSEGKVAQFDRRIARLRPSA